jgi:hypothetical protein
LESEVDKDRKAEAKTLASSPKSIDIATTGYFSQIYSIVTRLKFIVAY